MIKFYQAVNKRSKQAMIAFLHSHSRYNTMNSWNCSTSYANCVKIHRLDLTKAQQQVAFDLLDVQNEVWDEIHSYIYTWNFTYNHEWQVGFNGRSNGYMVLYHGGIDYANAKTARCTKCFKLTYHTVNTPCTTQECTGTLTVLDKPIGRVFTRPGQSTDMGETFEDWSIAALKERTELVQSFDKLCDECLAIFVSYCDDYDVVDEIIQVPKKIRVLKPKAV